MASEKKPLSGAYAALMQSEAWKDFVDYADKQCDSSMRMIDSKSACDLSLGEVCEERGFRKGMKKLIRYAEDCRDGV
jgi:hypothetical protein